MTRRRTTRARVALCLCAVATAGAACLSADDAVWPPVPTVRGVTPTENVKPDETVLVEFSGPVSIAAQRGSATRVVREDGRDVDISVVLDASARKLAISPSSRWPDGETLTVVIGSNLSDSFGRSVSPGEAITFSTRRARDSFVFALVEPHPSRPIAPNVRHFALSVAPEGAQVDRIWLENAQHRTEFAPLRFEAPNLLLARLVEQPEQTCPWLCPGMTYNLSLNEPFLPINNALARVTTSTLPDDAGPRLVLRSVERASGVLVVVFEADEPVFLRASAVAENQQPVSVVATLTPSRSPRAMISANEQQRGSLLRVTAVATDLADNVGSEIHVPVVLPPKVALRISEVVSTPLHDWGDSEARRQPFDAEPGNGVVTDADEWIEIVNISEHAIDLVEAQIILRVLDATPTETPLDSPSAMYFGAGGNPRHWNAGEALVIRPRGTMSQKDLVIEMPYATEMLDRVVISDAAEADHVGGRPANVTHEAIARDVSGRWRWCRPTPGDPMPSSSCL